MRIGSWVAGLVVTGLVGSAAPAADQERKLIQYGWGPKTPAYVAQNIRQMETKPFDGVAMVLDRNSFNHVFYNRELDDEQTEAYLRDLAGIKWEKFTDNFLMMYCRSNMDWFSEEDWGADGWVLRNVRLSAKAAKVGRCAGIFFDVESFWGRRPWWYARQPGADQRSFAEYERIVRRRGAQFMAALQDEYPGLVFLTSYLVSNPGAYAEVRREPDRARHSQLLQDGDEGLWPAFVNGMLDGAKGESVIADGHLRSYYHQERSEYEDAIRSARRKLTEGRPLGFDNDAPSRGWDRLLRQRAEPIEPKTAGIPRVAGPPPEIDGRLDDDAWKGAAELGPFVTYVESPIYELSTETRAYVAYDRTHLYVAFRCREPGAHALPSLGRPQAAVQHVVEMQRSLRQAVIRARGARVAGGLDVRVDAAGGGRLRHLFPGRFLP